MNDDNDTAANLTPAAAERQVDRGMTLAERMDLDGALADFTAVEAALRFSPDPAARVQWARSLNGLGFIDMMDAKAARAAVPMPWPFWTAPTTRGRPSSACSRRAGTRPMTAKCGIRNATRSPRTGRSGV